MLAVRISTKDQAELNRLVSFFRTKVKTVRYLLFLPEILEAIWGVVKMALESDELEIQAVRNDRTINRKILETKTLKSKMADVKENSEGRPHTLAVHLPPEDAIRVANLIDLFEDKGVGIRCLLRLSAIEEIWSIVRMALGSDSLIIQANRTYHKIRSTEHMESFSQLYDRKVFPTDALKSRAAEIKKVIGATPFDR